MAHQKDPLKILAIGSPLSSITTLISKITAINSKHGPFDACVLVGDLFKSSSDGSELEGVRFPVPTYFSIGRNDLPQSIKSKIGVEALAGEITDNLVFLGKSGVFTSAQGLKIGFVGGTFDQTTYDDNNEMNDQFSPHITKSSIKTILDHPSLNPSQIRDVDSLAAARSSGPLPSAFQGLDLLITSSPPPSISLLSPSFPTSGITLPNSSTPLSEIIKKSKPRYMFWSEGDGFWEREPFGWVSDDSTKEERWTRCVKLGALGAEGEGKKARWFYAFTLPPQTPSTPIPTRPANTTPNPFLVQSIPVSNGKKRPALDDQEAAFAGVNESENKRSKNDHGPPPEGYSCKICNKPGHWIVDCPDKTERDPNKPPEGYVCKLCQSSDHYIRECPKREARNAQGNKMPQASYVCRICGIGGDHFIKDCPSAKERDNERNKKKELGPAECWFCLSNPKVTKHLIVAIGNETYVTLPKGQLIPTLPKHIEQGGAKPLVPGGGHVLIIPIAHHPTLLSIPAEDAMTIISELEGFKSSLRACYASYGAVPVSFEVGRLGGRGGHAHVQIIPIPKELTDKVAESFRAAGKKQGIEWEAEPESALSKIGPTGNYFKVDCPDGTKLVHLLKGNFDLQFGRMVLASLMGLHHRIDWKDCYQTESEEKDDAVKFKKAFAPFHS